MKTAQRVNAKLSYEKTWWPGTELNRRRQPFQTINEPNHPFNQQLNSSRWPIYCDHSVTSADVRLSVGNTHRETVATIFDALGFKKENRVIAVKRTTTIRKYNDLHEAGGHLLISPC